MEIESTTTILYIYILLYHVRIHGIFVISILIEDQDKLRF